MHREGLEIVHEGVSYPCDRCDYQAITKTIKATGQIMLKSENNTSNNKDTTKMQYFAANA